MTQSELGSLLRSSTSLVQVGATPGTFFHNPDAHSSTVTAIGFGPQSVEAIESPDVPGIQDLHGRHEVLWIHVEGLADTQVVRDIAAEFEIHELAIADVVNIHQRPKVEEYDDHLFVVVRAPGPGDGLDPQQLSMFLGSNYLISFAERKSALLDPVRRRLESPKNTMRKKGSDYLAYAVIDAVIDSYFPVMESYGELLESVETRTIEHPDRGTSHAIHALRRDLLLLRRCVWPLRELINELTRGTSDIFSPDTRIYLRDCYDHAVHVLDIVETYRELTFGLMDLYMSSLTSRMNEVMKLLTIIATVFIPLGFIAGIYGMNFDRASPWNLPELGWTYGYPFALAVMACVAAGLLWYFRSKGWIGADRA